MDHAENSSTALAANLRDQAEICLAALSRMPHRADLHLALIALAAEFADRADEMDPQGEGVGLMLLATLHGRH